MESFVAGLFRESPDLSVLTHAIVRKKYLAHTGKEILTKEEKDKLKRLIEKELLQIQIDDSDDEELAPLAKSRGQKRPICVSDNSEEEVESKRERKKQRTAKVLEFSSDEEDSGIDSKKAQIFRGPKHARKSLDSSDHVDSGAEDPTDKSYASRERHKTQREMTSYKHHKQDASVEESESDLDEAEVHGLMTENTHMTKTQRTSAGKDESDSDLEEKESLKKQVKKQGMKKAQGRGASNKKPAENQKCRNLVKQHRGHKPKRSVSRKESGSETEEGKGSERKSKGTLNSSGSGNESLSEAEQRGESKKQKITSSSNDSESSSDETTDVNQRQKRLLKKREVNKEGSGSESSQEEKEPKKKGSEKSQQESVSELESECDSEESGSISLRKVKNKRQQQKGTKKPQDKSNSKKESRSELDKEDVRSSSGEEDSPRCSKLQHQGKNKEHHAAKGEDHPSIRRLKRYIWACGVHRNYKKLLLGCRSRKAQLEVLKKELEGIGLKGPPTLAKCKALKKRLEEAAEVAALDLSNIIVTEGRPKRRNVWSLYSKPEEPPGSPEESPIRRPSTDWSHLRGVISSDDESD